MSHKNIGRHIAHTFVSWPNPKQWVIVQTSDLIMIIRLVQNHQTYCLIVLTVSRNNYIQWNVSWLCPIYSYNEPRDPNNLLVNTVTPINLSKPGTNNTVMLSSLGFCSNLIPLWTIFIILLWNVQYIRNWPRYGLRWSGLCCHSRHSTRGAGLRAAACGPAGRTSAVPGVAAQTTLAQTIWVLFLFLFYHENVAIHDKSRDDHDDEPPCCGSHIRDVTIAKLLTFEIRSGTARNERYDFRLSKTTWRFNYKWKVVFCNDEYHQRLNSRPWWQILSAIERICGALNRFVSDVIIIWHTQRARRKMYLISSALPNVLLVMACRWRVGIVKIL